MRIYVINRAGRYIPGHGSRAYGGSFELPDKVAQDYLVRYPDDYSKEPPGEVDPPEEASETPPESATKKKRGEK